jgi:class 3 adenylate cyclase
MSDVQPSGTVTLVFTDVEGSTKLLEELGTDAYRGALAEHRLVVREAFGAHRGYEVDYEGDAFFYTFASAQAAVSAVSEAMAASPRGRSASASASTPASLLSIHPSTSGIAHHVRRAIRVALAGTDAPSKSLLRSIPVPSRR